MNFDLQWLSLMKNLVSPKTLISLILNHMTFCSLENLFFLFENFPFYRKVISIRKHIHKVHHIRLPIDQNAHHKSPYKIDFFPTCLLRVVVAGHCFGGHIPGPLLRVAVADHCFDGFFASVPDPLTTARSRCYGWP